jgi:hypothetical protein
MGMIAEVMDHCKNHFVKSHEYGAYTFAASTKKITGSFDRDYFVGALIYVMNSVLNDDVFTIAATGTDEITVTETLQDETNTGVVHIFALRPPRAFLSLVTDIETWCAAHPAAVQAVQQESIDDYSVSYGLGVQRGGGWQAAFSGRLGEYRSIYDDLPRIGTVYDDKAVVRLYGN